MAVYVKVSDVIKLMKSLRNDGYKEVTFCSCRNANILSRNL